MRWKKGIQKNIFVCIIIIVSIIATVFDATTLNYIWGLENLFDFDLSNVVSVGLALWAFTTGLVILLLGKKDERFMGITYNELYEKRTKKYSGSIEKAIVCIIIIMIFSTVLEYPITMLVSVIMQMLIMVRTFFLMRDIFSNDIIEKLIGKDFDDIFNADDLDNIMHMAFAKKIGYSEGRDSLIVTVIKRAKLDEVQTRVRLVKILQTIMHQNEHMESVIIKSRILIDTLISKRDIETANQVIETWFLDNKNSVIVQKGIIFGLVEKQGEQAERFIVQLLDATEQMSGKKRRNELAAWFISSSAFLTRFVQYEDRKIFMPKWKMFYDEQVTFFPEEKWEAMVFDQWFWLCVAAEVDVTSKIEIIYEIIGCSGEDI